MSPFEDLIHDLGQQLGVVLTPDEHQSCLLTFPPDDIKVQIDLDTDANQIVVGSQLGRLTPGPYRDRIIDQAMRANGDCSYRRGILAYSEKNDTLVLFQFLALADLTGEKLFHFLQAYLTHAKIWELALRNGEVPQFGAAVSTDTEKMFGLNR